MESVSRPTRYEYLLEVEQSGGARSYLAIDRSPWRPAHLVVVHLAPASITRDEALLRQFAARAAALLPLSHANLVRTLGYVADSRHAHWVSEAVQGQPLSALLTKTRGGRRALSTWQLIAILCDVLRGLEHAHGAADAAGAPFAIVHRNLCPASVLVTYEGLVKVSDGVSSGSPDAPIGLLEGPAQRFAYQAPECFHSGPVDLRSDLYAVGAILWEGVVGHPRTVGVTLQHSIDMRLQGSEPDVASACPGVSPALAEVIRRALAIDPGNRYQSARELREGLEALASSAALRGERGSLFGLMCNHFCDEHAALQELLDQRAQGVLHMPLGPGEPRGAGPESEAPDRGPAVQLPEVARVLPRPPPEPESIRRSSMGRRWRRAGWFVSIVGTIALGVVFVGPPRHEPPSGVSPPAVLVERLTPAAPAPSTASPRMVARPVNETGSAEPAAPPREEERSAPVLEKQQAAPAPEERLAVAAAGEQATRRARFRRPAARPGAPLAPPRAPASAPAAASVPAPAGAIQLAGEDAATFSALTEASANGTGVDLRTLKRRPPRAIDKQDPYSR